MLRTPPAALNGGAESMHQPERTEGTLNFTHLRRSNSFEQARSILSKEATLKKESGGGEEGISCSQRLRPKKYVSRMKRPRCTEGYCQDHGL